jgi:hypothetical protein
MSKPALSLDTTKPGISLDDNEEELKAKGGKKPSYARNPDGSLDVEGTMNMSPTGAAPAALDPASQSRAAAVSKKLGTKQDRKDVRMAASAIQEHDRMTPGVLGAARGGTGKTPEEAWRTMFAPKPPVAATAPTAPTAQVPGTPGQANVAGGGRANSAPPQTTGAAVASAQPVRPMNPAMMPANVARMSNPVGGMPGQTMSTSRVGGETPGTVNAIKGVGHSFTPRTGAESTARNLYVGDETGDRTAEVKGAVKTTPQGKRGLAVVSPTGPEKKV